MIITIYLLFIGISRKNRKFPENFLISFDCTINSKYVILLSKKKGKNPQIFGNQREDRKFSGMTRVAYDKSIFSFLDCCHIPQRRKCRRQRAGEHYWKCILTYEPLSVCWSIGSDVCYTSTLLSEHSISYLKKPRRHESTI